MSTFRHGHELAPNWIYPNTNVGMIFSILNQSDSALNYFKSSLNLDPNYSRTYTFIAWEFGKRNEIDSALYYINEGLSRDKNDPELMTLKGDLLNKKGEKEQAINCYYAAYKTDSTYIDAYAGALKYHVENFVSQDSLEFYMGKMILTDATNPYPYLYLANYLASLEIYDVAITYYNLSYSLDSLNTEMWNGLGDVYLKLEHRDTAMMLYDYSLSIDPEYAITYNRKGNLEYYNGNIEGAISCYLKAHEINPWESFYNKTLAEFYKENKDYQNSINFYLLYLDQYNINPTVYIEIVRDFALLKEIDSAIKYLNIGIEEAPWLFDIKELKKDPELKLLKKDKEYKQILKNLKKK